MADRAIETTPARAPTYITLANKEQPQLRRETRQISAFSRIRSVLNKKVLIPLGLAGGLALSQTGPGQQVINAGSDFLNSIGQTGQEDRDEIGTGGQTPEQTIEVNTRILNSDREHRISGETWEIDLEGINIRPSPEVNDKPSDDSIPANGENVTELNGLPVNPHENKVVVTFPIMTQGEGTQGTLSEAPWIEVTYKTITNGQERIGYIMTGSLTDEKVKTVTGANTEEVNIVYRKNPTGSFSITADGREIHMEDIGVTSTVAKQE